MKLFIYLSFSMVSVVSILIIPATHFSSHDAWRLSVIIRTILALIFVYTAMFHIIRKSGGNKSRGCFAIAIALSISILGTLCDELMLAVFDAKNEMMTLGFIFALGMFYLILLLKRYVIKQG